MASPFGQAKAAYGVVRDSQKATEHRPLIICGNGDVVDPLRAALAAGAPDAGSYAQAYALRRLDKDDRKELKQAAVVVYGGTVLNGLDDATRQDLEVVGSAKRPVVALLEALDLPSHAITEAARVRGVSPDDIIPYRRGGYPTERAMKELAARAGDSAPWVASGLPAFRPHVTEYLIEHAARRNARISLLIFIPGADMPVLTATQMRLVLRIAACYGEEIGQQRAIELLGVLGAGFGFRAVARSMLDFVPIAGWALQSAIAYAGTRAVGQAAVEYFEHGAVADVSKVRALSEGLRIEIMDLVERFRTDGIDTVRERFRGWR